MPEQRDPNSIRSGFDTQSSELYGLSDQQLRYGYWYVTHKEQLKKLLNGFLIAFSVICYSYVLINTIIFYGFQYNDYRQGIDTISLDYVNVLGVHNQNQILPLDVLSRKVIASSDGKIDIVALVKNPNQRWALASFDYSFSVSGKVYPKQQSFLLPGEQKYVLLLNVDGLGSGTPQIFIDNYQWQRVTNYDLWAPERLKFTIKNKQFVAARQGEISDRLPVSEATADISNDSAYNYHEVELQVALFSGNTLVGINRIPLQDFKSGDKRSISARWTQSLPVVTSVDIIPTVNIIDQSVYKDFKGDFTLSLLD